MLLPNGCSCSTPSIHPANWKTGGVSLLKKKWFLQYYFKDPSQSEEFQKKWPYGKPIRVQFSRGLKTLQEFKDTAKAILENELRMLQMEGYNPITGISYIQEVFSSDIPDSTRLSIALQKALESKKKKVTNGQYLTLKSTLKYTQLAIKLLALDDFPVGQLRKKHIRFILDRLADIKKDKWTPHCYNAYRKDISALLDELIEFEALDVNPVRDIPKKPVVKKIKETLSRDERKKVDSHLKKMKEFRLRLYSRIFYHSGGRSMELFRLQGKHINLDTLTMRTIIYKRRQPEEVEKPIKKIAKRYWKLALANCGPEDFIFSWGLKPGPTQLKTNIVTDKWYKLVKAPIKNGGLGIDVDFYAYKHCNTTEMVDITGIEAAAQLNGHTGTAMVRKIYDTKRISREHAAIREATNAF